MGKVTGAGFTDRCASTTSTTPWALYVLAIVLAVCILLAVGAFVGRRRGDDENGRRATSGSARWTHSFNSLTQERRTDPPGWNPPQDGTGDRPRAWSDWPPAVVRPPATRSPRPRHRHRGRGDTSICQLVTQRGRRPDNAKDYVGWRSDMVQIADAAGSAQYLPLRIYAVGVKKATASASRTTTATKKSKGKKEKGDGERRRQQFVRLTRRLRRPAARVRQATRLMVRCRVLVAIRSGAQRHVLSARPHDVVPCEVNGVEVRGGRLAVGAAPDASQLSIRAVVITVVMVCMVLGTGPGLRTGAGAATPTLTVSPLTAAVGQTVHVNGRGLPPRGIYQVQVCGRRDATHGSPDCAGAAAATSSGRPQGMLAGPLTVVLPPTQCPCVVAAFSTGLAPPLTTPISIEGAGSSPRPTRPPADPDQPHRRRGGQACWVDAGGAGGPVSGDPDIGPDLAEQRVGGRQTGCTSTPVSAPLPVVSRRLTALGRWTDPYLRLSR